MRLLLLLVVFVSSKFVKDIAPDLATLRNLYYRSALEKNAATEMLKLLLQVDDKSSPVLVCYKGVAEMMQAKYVISPFSKVSRFKKGKTWIEAAITRDPQNLEIRFLRFSIQTNLPGFLGYNDDISDDKKKLLDGINQVNDKVLKQNIIKYLSGSKYCTVEELKKISNE